MRCHNYEIGTVLRHDRYHGFVSYLRYLAIKQNENVGTCIIFNLKMYYLSLHTAIQYAVTNIGFSIPVVGS